MGVMAAGFALAWVTWRSGPRATTLPVTPPPASPAASAEFAPLLGPWIRPDGGYVLSVSEVRPDGSASVAYYNPRSIRVVRAEARREEGLPSLFIEFADHDYPGSTYTLRYVPGTDTLEGVYYQAVQRARYDVVFVRQR
jgi:hypothetical protein